MTRTYDLAPGALLTENQVGILRGLVRDALRKAERNRAAGERRYGAAWDDTRSHARIMLLLDTYRSLGGQPERIENLDLPELHEPGAAGEYIIRDEDGAEVERWPAAPTQLQQVGLNAAGWTWEPAS